MRGFETLFIIKFSVAFFFIIAVNGNLIGICSLEDWGPGGGGHELSSTRSKKLVDT